MNGPNYTNLNDLFEKLKQDPLFADIKKTAEQVRREAEQQFFHGARVRWDQGTYTDPPPPQPDRSPDFESRTYGDFRSNPRGPGGGRGKNDQQALTQLLYRRYARELMQRTGERAQPSPFNKFLRRCCAELIQKGDEKKLMNLVQIQVDGADYFSILVH